MLLCKELVMAGGNPSITMQRITFLIRPILGVLAGVSVL